MENVADTYANKGMPDLPQIQGVIYFEACRSCLVDWEHERSYHDDCEFCYHLTFALDVQYNEFTGNQDGVAFYEEHTLERASHIFHEGPGLVNITANVFENLEAMFYSVADDSIPTYVGHLPDYYFNHLQSPLIRVKFPEQVDYLYDTLVASDDDDLVEYYSDPLQWTVANCTLLGNTF